MRSNGMVLQGPEAVAAAAKVRQERDSKGQWPYKWAYPPPGAIRVNAGLDASGSLLVPAAGTPTEALLYTVDDGFFFGLESLLVSYLKDGAVGAANPGDFTWSLTVNQPVGTAAYQGYSVQGLTAVDVPLGSLQIFWPVVCHGSGLEVFESLDQLRIVVTNVNLTNGSPNWFKCALRGWKWPIL